MLLFRRVLLSAFLALAPAIANAQVMFHGLGSPPGGATPSSVRGATKVGTFIYAVGTSGPNAVLWIWNGVEFVATPLPNAGGVAGVVAASAITPNADYIASQARTATNPVAVRVDRNALTNLNVNFSALAGASLAGTISDNGLVLYGVSNGSRAARFDVAASSSTLIPRLPGTPNNRPAFGGSSSDGSVMVGTSFTPPFGGAGGHAFRYVHGVGVAAIPELGTWSKAIAVSANGNLTLVGGNSPFLPNGEMYFYATGPGGPTTTALGSPNTEWAPMDGGMTADGSVVVATFGEVGTAAKNAFFHNNNGWFLLTSALAAVTPSIAVEWNTILLGVNGISPDGTLVFGAGDHNGVQEGFVAEFPPGFLANFSAPAVAPINTTIVGTWVVPENPGAPGATAHLVLLGDGTFFLIETIPPDSPGGPIPLAGFERGTYSWNAATGALSVTTRQSTKGDSGLSGFNGISGLTAFVTDNVTDDTLTVNFPPTSGDGTGFSLVATRLTSGATSIVSGWQLVNPGAGTPDPSDDLLAVLLLQGDGTYFLAEDGVPEPAGHPGIEKGSYSWSPVTGALPLAGPFSATPIFENDGGWGFSNPAPGVTTFELKRDGLVITGTDINGSFSFARIVDPNLVRPTITSALSATGIPGALFTYTVTTAWPALVTGATGLPAGLTIDATTGVISGTPTVLGTFTVALSTSNTLSAASATLNLVIANAISFGPTDLWIGLKNSDDVGTKFDLLVEGFRNGVPVTSAQIDSVPGGSSGFNNAVLRQISTASSSMTYGVGDKLSVRVSVRIAATSGHRSGTARLWFGDAAANSRVETIVNGQPKSFYLATGFALKPTVGPGPKSTVDVLVDRAVGGNPFKAFGTWSITF